MGHLRTILPRLRHAVAPRPAVLGERWLAEVPDERWGSVRVGGWWSAAADSGGSVVLVHGLGGSSGSHYIGPAVAAVRAAGWSALVVELRGADGRGEDFYHAGLLTDLAAAIAGPLAAVDEVALLGFSLGGHVALRYAALAPDPRLRAVAAVCAPLDLGAAQRAIDSPACWLYRQYLLANLRRQYRAVAERRGLPLDGAQSARTLREWDAATVVPRWGFADPDDYYATQSVAPRLRDLAIPALLLLGDGDPMVPLDSVRPSLSLPAPRLSVRVVAGGGHVAFPPGVDLGVAGSLDWLVQVVGWLSARMGGEASPRSAARG